MISMVQKQNNSMERHMKVPAHRDPYGRSSKRVGSTKHLGSQKRVRNCG